MRKEDENNRLQNINCHFILSHFYMFIFNWDELMHKCSLMMIALRYAVQITPMLLISLYFVAEEFVLDAIVIDGMSTRGVPKTQPSRVFQSSHRPLSQHSSPQVKPSWIYKIVGTNKIYNHIHNYWTMTSFHARLDGYLGICKRTSIVYVSVCLWMYVGFTNLNMCWNWL